MRPFPDTIIIDAVRAPAAHTDPANQNDEISAINVLNRKRCAHGAVNTNASGVTETFLGRFEKKEKGEEKKKKKPPPTSFGQTNNFRA
jgi:hypothetical protein